MRKAVSGLFNSAPETGRDYVTARPRVNLPKLDLENPRRPALPRGQRSSMETTTAPSN
jgi:hypothetical protein